MRLGRKRRPKTLPCRGPLDPNILRVGDVVTYNRWNEESGWDHFVVQEILYNENARVKVRMRRIDSQDIYYDARGLKRKEW